MLTRLRLLLERFWVWLGGELPVAESSVPVEPGPGQFLYVVQPSDTLRSIARRFSTSVWILADLNDLAAPSLIRAGQRLLIPRPGARPPAPPAPSPEPGPEAPVEPEPGPFIYIVQTGDTLSAIARRFGVTAAGILETNHVQDPNLMRPGQRLLIRGPEPQPEPAPFPPPAPEPAPEPPPARLEPIPLPLPEPAPETGPEPTPVFVPESTSEPIIEPVPKHEPLPGQYVYVVQPGDTLLRIARRFNVTLRALIEANDIEDPNLIQADQRLIIPGIYLAPTTTPPPEPAPPQPTPLPYRPGIAHPTGTAPGTTLGTAHPPDTTLGTTHPPDTTLGTGLLSIPWPDDAIRGIYVSYFALGQQEQRRRVTELLTKTEINALVIDVKGDYGLISYPTSVALAHDIGAARPTAHDFDELMNFFKANGVYTIARIVAFKDHPFANAHPEWATQREGGGLWHDREQLAWVDPFVKATWEYSADLAEEAANRGFDEIQFGYVRFPIHSQEGVPHFSQPLSLEARVGAITGFLSYIRSRLASLSVRVAADVFGYTCWRKDDTLIGQDIGRMAQYLDVLCPMLYPSTFGSGIPGFENAIAYPYEIVYESVKRAVHQVAPLGCHVRPWIQDFPDYRFDKRVYGPAEVRAQMRGSFDSGGAGYMAWDPRMRYTTGAYLKNAIDMSLSDDYN